MKPQRSTVQTLFLLTITVLLLYAPVWAQSDADSAEENENPAGVGDLFETRPSDSPEPIALDEDALELPLGSVVKMPQADRPIAQTYKLTLDKPSVVTIFVDGPTEFDLVVNGPDGRHVPSSHGLGSDLGFAEANDLVFPGRINSTQALRTVIYRLNEPGDYAVRLSIPIPTGKPTAVGASVFEIPEAFLKTEDAAAAPLANNPGAGAVANIPPIAATPSRWIEGRCVANLPSVDFEFTADRDQRYTAIVRTQENSDISIELYLQPDNPAQDPQLIGGSDDDPLGHFGSESHTFEAEAGKTYTIRLRNLMESDFRLRLYLLPIHAGAQE